MSGAKDQKYSLTDLVPLDKLQKIQNYFAVAAQVASTITDLDGVPITTPSNHCDVCKMVRSTEKGHINCKRSARTIGEEAHRLMRPYHRQCLSCGFSDAAAPIIVNGEHVANWLIGQYYIREVDEKHIREYAREIEADEDKMAEAFIAMPKISEERFNNALSFLWIMANEISAMGYQNLMQKKQTEELRKVKRQLERHKKDLEKTVDQRTAALLRLNEKLKKEIDKKNKVQKDQSRLIAAIESAAESIVITDTQSRIIYVNPAFQEITGYSPEEVIGKNPSILKSGLHDDDFYKQFWEIISVGKTWTGRFRNKRKDGSIYQEETTVSPVQDEKGKITNYVGVKRDITKELELERQLQQVSKLESIGTLAAGIAHEINTPVQYVRDNTKFLEEALEDLSQLNGLHQILIDDARAKKELLGDVEKIEELKEEIDYDFLTDETGKAIDGALEGLDRISSIVLAMKEFSHPGSNEPQPEDLNLIIDSTVKVSRAEWKNSAEVILNLDKKLPLVPVISGQIKQVLLNLIVNAAQAISDKGKAANERGEIVITTNREDGTVKLSLKDNGVGIPSDIIDKIFDPFFTTKEVGKGTGQGLAIAFKTIVDGHGGGFEVISDVGEGAEFIITLPCTSE